MPAWCDRVLLNGPAFAAAARPHYAALGARTCMGDHKPVYLALDLTISHA